MTDDHTTNQSSEDDSEPTGFFATLLTMQTNWASLDPITQRCAMDLAEHFDYTGDRTGGAKLTRLVGHLTKNTCPL
ncbi:hypothetical protein NLX83_13230 [Allokutzneria sp. A3M-2-11 16]|uniref:hypothetical protein n=1 Tax=Allokutzneria sp. A3M-2-11 16 TaxID=2962043 RepID=UPI0020B84F5A|nr:hypothetical protein [Allokutzneria sp. A3M-2-11 16]MCP3800222.1 hypothetical protein [Allokutzneria sp. A3M-2-11 16]